MADYLLNDIVSEYLVENGKAENQRARFYTIALSGLREIHLDINGIVKIVEMCINDNDTVDLPNDFVNYRKIGIVGADGRIHSLGRDTDMNLMPDCGVEGRDIKLGDNINPYDGMPYMGPFGSMNGNGGIFAIGGGNNNIGYYRLNRKTNQLWLSGLNTLTQLGFSRVNSIIMEYVADVNSDGEDFIVHPFAVQAIKDWIGWRAVFGDRNTGGGDKEQKRREYFNSRRICQARYGSSTPEEWIAALRKNNTATVRF
jgi:hypothetical protein